MKTPTLVSWVWVDDGGGNAEFEDIDRSYAGLFLLSEVEIERIKGRLRPYFQQGVICDVYVGPVEQPKKGYRQALQSIAECLEGKPTSGEVSGPGDLRVNASGNSLEEQR